MKPAQHLILAWLMVAAPICTPDWLLAGPGPQQDVPARDWIQLFNGQDLNGWDVKISGHDLNDNYNQTFRVEDGLLRVVLNTDLQFDGRFGHLFYREKFSHYLLAVEYRFVGKPIPGLPEWLSRINSGVMVHAQSAQSMGKDQNFPVSLEVQLLGGDGVEETSNANLCPLGTMVELNGQETTEDCLPSSSETFHGDQWVRVEVRVLGGSQVEHMVNGTTVMTYRNPKVWVDERHHFDPTGVQDATVRVNGAPLEDGHIALQSETHPIEFRKVELLNLVGCNDPKATNYRAYFVQSDPSRCSYGGSSSP